MEEVIRRYGDAVYRLAYSYMHNVHDADDVFQDVFLRYAERAPTFRDEEHRRAWLLRVTINRCRSHYRSAWWKRIVPLDAAAHAASPAPDDPALDEALAKLPTKYRTVIHLHYYEHYDQQEIAVVLGIQAVSVRSRLTRARQMLRSLLKEGDDDV